MIVGATFSATTAQLTAFAYQKKKVGGTQDGESKNGNTVTIEECKNRGSASGFDTAVDQECENLICTHPGENATCIQEGVVTSTPTPTPEPITTTLRVIKKVVCQPTDPNCSLPNFCEMLVFSSSKANSQAFTCQSAVGNGVLLHSNQGIASM